HKYWGDVESNPTADPSPRLQLIVEAARRGATVRLLPDSFFDKPSKPCSNRATADYLNAIAASEGLDLAAATGNPTGGDIHARYALVQVGSKVEWPSPMPSGHSQSCAYISEQGGRMMPLKDKHAAVFVASDRARAMAGTAVNLTCGSIMG
ncbi:MAG: hypothetical protein IT329_01760, partial [Caldilineaceae bacterium]|nr:hypothetical protein [Caldilineaceae bacterium]